ncbi:NIP2-3 [Symbiodinium natans]|uniref:NIP2-3 protein n=1 Tax=Symbiodinium natans TaxID=878477 RepID=A0A812TYW5_9DINO|nr:NIP2-3 [Symbiodinium natans]
MAAEPSLRAKCVAEFVGTFLLIFTVVCNLATGSPLFAGFSIGTVLFVMIQSFGKVSGGNFNPAVSVALGFTKAMGGPGMEWSQVLIYSVVQIVGGIAAAFAATLLCGKSFPVAATSGYTTLSAGVCEYFYTFMLTFVVLNVAAAKKNAQENGQYYGLAIGFTVIAGAYGAGFISGGCFNPAVAIALDVTSIDKGFGISFVYILFEILAALTSAFIFSKIRPEDFEKSPSTGKASEQLLSEFVGTFMLVLTVACNIFALSSIAALSIAASLASMIYATGDVSGGHFNPAVSLAVYLSGRDTLFTERKCFLYMLVQTLAGLLAAVIAVSTFSTHSTFGPKAPYSLGQALIAELVFTYVLTFVVLAVAVSQVTKSTQFFGLAIGFCVVVGGFGIGGISGGALNPAVALGLAVSGGGLGNALGYTGVQLVAAGLAAITFKITHEADLDSPEAKSFSPA